MTTIEANGRKLEIYLPPSYGHTDQRYPVVYLQDGGSLAACCWNLLDKLQREKSLPELILAGVPSPDRNGEYTPWPAAAVSPGRPDFGGGGRAYVDELADVIKPAVDRALRTKPEREHTAVAGGSLGGLISLFAALWRPDRFGAAGLLSPSLWFDGVMASIRTGATPDSALRLYVSVGSCEGRFKANRQRDMVPFVLEACRIWESGGFPGEQLRLHVEEGATHDLLFMARQLPDALRHLFAGSAADEPPGTAASSSPGEGMLPAASLAGKKAGVHPRASDAEASASRPNMDREDGRYRVSGTESFLMRSRHTGQEYEIYVHVPGKPAPPAGYPVLYAVDGNAYFGTLAEAMRLQTRHPRGLPPGMIVAIGYRSDEPFVTGRRFVDLTIPAELDGVRPDGSAWPDNGGADPFLDFISLELMPEIHRRYPADRSRQSLFGHSLGGFFTLYAMISRPGLFSSYVAGSPSVWWKEQALLKLLPDLEARLSGGTQQARLLIAVGSAEKPFMLQDARDLYRRLQPHEGHGFQVRYLEFPDEGHVSVLHPLISPMLRFLFADD